MPGTFSPSPRVSDPDMHHGTYVTHVPWCMPGSLTSGFFWSRWRGNVPGACATRKFAYLVRGPLPLLPNDNIDRLQDWYQKYPFACTYECGCTLVLTHIADSRNHNIIFYTCWRHQMETFSALLALCEGYPSLIGGFPLQRPVICVWTNNWANDQDAGGLRRHRTHYDVSVMNIQQEESDMKVKIIMHRILWVFWQIAQMVIME